MRQMVAQLTDKLMAVSGAASDRYHQYRLAELQAQAAPSPQVVTDVPGHDQNGQEMDFLNDQMQQMVERAKTEMNV